ncbi:MAG: 16S rRNA (adenine(1518)-N(6)/adenine(1519)-N(6))-dimethyltransferase RsmA [Pseudomonadota bacterium]
MRPLPPLREVIAACGLAADKSLGQHFLLDLNLTAKIARLAGPFGDAPVVEIGPGPGGLTRALLAAGAQFVLAIERDARCEPALGAIAAAYPGGLSAAYEDALGADEPALLEAAGHPAPAHIVSNLPYNIGSALTVKWLTAAPRWWRSMTLMFQKEVAERICAPVGGKSYGRLSVIAQAAATPTLAMELPARAFTPPPKVASAVVRFEPKAPACDLRTLERVTAAAFGQRRKMLRSSLKPLFGTDTERRLEACGLASTARAEEIPVASFERLAGAITP